MSLAAEETSFLSDVIARRSGNVISDRQAFLFEAKLSQVAHSAGLADVHALVQELRRNPRTPLCQKVTEAMTINETSFFRDVRPFDALQHDILPELIEDRQNTRSLSIWSAACSSGQEPYSIALLLRTHFPQLEGWNVKIQATDIAEVMVTRTQLGMYTQFEVGRGLPSAMLLTNFERVGLNWQVRPYVRRLVCAEQRNLLEEWPRTEMHDVIFLRNVLVYFDQKTKQDILWRIHQSLRPGGYLFLGGGETMLNLNVPFFPVSLGKTVCFQPMTG